jgi:hypothetical protein
VTAGTGCPRRTTDLSCRRVSMPIKIPHHDDSDTTCICRDDRGVYCSCTRLSKAVPSKTHSFGKSWHPYHKASPFTPAEVGDQEPHSIPRLRRPPIKRHPDCHIDVPGVSAVDRPQSAQVKPQQSAALDTVPAPPYLSKMTTFTTWSNSPGRQSALSPREADAVHAPVDRPSRLLKMDTYRRQRQPK